MVRAILADINIDGHVRALKAVLEGPRWKEYWESLGVQFVTFAEVGIPAATPDNSVWNECQRQQYVLLTANRNADGPDSLEMTLRTLNTHTSLPVFTIGTAGKVLTSREYAERVTVRLLELLSDIDRILGAGRLYLP